MAFKSCGLLYSYLFFLNQNIGHGLTKAIFSVVHANIWTILGVGSREHGDIVAVRQSRMILLQWAGSFWKSRVYTTMWI